MAMTIERLFENFEVLTEWEDRYRLIIDLGRKLPNMPEDLKTEETKVKGCMSQVWMVMNMDPDQGDKMNILADSDAHIVKGLIAILLMLYSGKTKEEMQAVNVEDTFEKLGLESHLSMNRRNGFYAMVNRIKTLSQTGAH